ncbi:MAG: Putrescine transport ATP-binding protein PotG [uncultured Thermomicrobiales bacterium]|uniref:Spermidine/putrescine import ATP-binding protein PotA n=1 Tax=uncultured Thermomicrobiales bacterium TaxID=1645740 RepID=A0A6J4U013_9BACT|nr:MAG: Putrescine transport ATP-binding protein PotG [uncultured Thermomicrobiales bacterium]
MVDHDVALREVTKRFGDLAAVDGVSLDIERGQFLTLLGPSGCGKTTTLRMIGGFEFPDTGEIYLRGEPMGRRPPYRRDTSMVFQNYALFPHMDIAANIGYGLRERKVAKAEIARRVEGMLALVELPGLGGRRPKQLSGGQQQRVALARSLVIEPTVLLLDEPLGALDLKLRRQMQLELKRIQREVGITFIYVTHDQEEALTMSDRIAVMNRGRVEQYGSAEAIFERPATRFVADFMGASNILDAEVVDADAGSARIRVAGAALTVSEAGLRPGDRVALMVRPEKLRLTAATGPDGTMADGATGWDATVAARVYKGATMAYQLGLPGGHALVADVANAPGGARFEPDQPVRVALRPNDAVVIRG